MLEPRGKGLVAKTLRYAYEVRKNEEFFEDIGDVEVAPEMLELATTSSTRSSPASIRCRFEDRYQNAVLELIKAKGGKEAAGAEIGSAALQRDQPHRCAEEERSEREGRGEGARTASRARKAAGQGDAAGPTRGPARAARAPGLKRAS
jgi:DNA end-binding protein Ku